MPTSVKIAFLTAAICVLACEVSSAANAQNPPPELIYTMPSSGRILPNENHRCSKTFIVDAPPVLREKYKMLQFVVTQDGKRNSKIRFNLKNERRRWPDRTVHEGVQGYLGLMPVPWNTKLYFADPSGTEGRDFAVELYLFPVKTTKPQAKSVGKVSVTRSK